MKKRKIIGMVIAFLLLTGVIGYYSINAYVKDYYHASKTAEQILDKTDGDVSIEYKDDGTIYFIPKEVKAGLVFYQGGKVEAEAYAPLLYQMAENNIMCVLPKMPFNFAFMDYNAAQSIIEENSKVTEWYVGGHSLGGAMAGKFAASHGNMIKGVIFLGAYSENDLSKSELKTVTIFGTEDKILSKSKYEENKKNLPSTNCEYIIEGGCHSYFGSYGMQKGDGEPTISPKEQVNMTVDYLSEIISPKQ